MTVFQALFLGVLQGVTEFLPISSSAHLILAPWAFGWPDPGLAYDVFLHLGTLLAVLSYFFRDLIGIVRAGFLSIIERKIGFERDRLLFWLVGISTIPGGLAGYLFNDAAETAFRAPLLIAVSLAGMGFLLYWIDGRNPAVRGMEEMSLKDSIWIGLAQMFAIFPGVSRSGSTMTMARLLGFTREAAARYSFLLSIPITSAAIAFKIPHVIHLGRTGMLSPSYLVAGFLGSFVAGILTIHLLLGYLRMADFRIFAWYRMAVAVAIVVWALVAGR